MLIFEEVTLRDQINVQDQISVQGEIMKHNLSLEAYYFDKK